jgi:OmpA-OmpF porin, OOP family
MRKLVILLCGLSLSAAVYTAAAETDGNVYLGLGATSLALDSERIEGVPTRSPGHSSKLGSLILGYQFNDRWSVDLGVGTNLGDNVDVNQFTVNGYRFFGEHKWKPFISAGFSGVSIDDAPEDQTEQFQAGIGVSGALTDKLEFRASYQLYSDTGEQVFHDDSVNISLNWHFRKPITVAAAPAPQPETVPAKKEVIDTYELLVQFDFDKSNIKSVYKPQFDEIAQVLKDSPDVSMTVEGHTCWIGTEKYNQGLSERRADAVRKMFIEDYGFAADRINVEGYGESRPVADNNTQAGREKNRRAIAVILKPRMATEESGGKL